MFAGTHRPLRSCWVVGGRGDPALVQQSSHCDARAYTTVLASCIQKSCTFPLSSLPPTCLPSHAPSLAGSLPRAPRLSLCPSVDIRRKGPP